MLLDLASMLLAGSPSQYRSRNKLAVLNPDFRRLVINLLHTILLRQRVLLIATLNLL